MKALRNIFTNPWALLGLVAYGISVVVLWQNKAFAPEDAISVLVIFGLLFPLLGWVTTRGARPLSLTVKRSALEMWLVLTCLIGVTLYLIWGTAWSEALVPASWLSSEQGKFLVVFARKLIVFVAIPFVLFRTLFGYRWRDFGVQFAGARALAGNHLPVVLVLCIATRFSVVCGQRSGADPAR